MRHSAARIVAVALVALLFCSAAPAAEDLGLTLSWKDNYLTIRGEKLPGREMKVLYIEAYCRPGAHERRWEQTTIGHKTRLVSAAADGKRLDLECVLNDGVVVKHEITVGADVVDFHLTATNPTTKDSAVQWAQPCVQVGAFTGGNKETYLGKCFVFLDGKLERMPTRQWSTEALYTPGQVWCPTGVDRADVNPRPLSPLVTSNGLIGCYSEDEKMIFAVAFEPYQELFQGVITCIHSDFRIGGLKAGETKRVRGRMYFAGSDVGELLKRYRTDFPEHLATGARSGVE